MVVLTCRRHCGSVLSLSVAGSNDVQVVAMVVTTGRLTWPQSVIGVVDLLVSQQFVNSCCRCSPGWFSSCSSEQSASVTETRRLSVLSGSGRSVVMVIFRHRDSHSLPTHWVRYRVVFVVASSRTLVPCSSSPVLHCLQSADIPWTHRWHRCPGARGCVGFKHLSTETHIAHVPVSWVK